VDDVDLSYGHGSRDALGKLSKVLRLLYNKRGLPVPIRQVGWEPWGSFSLVNAVAACGVTLHLGQSGRGGLAFEMVSGGERASQVAVVAGSVLGSQPPVVLCLACPVQFGHDSEIYSELLSEEALVDEKEEEDHTIGNGTYVVKGIDRMEMLVEHCAACWGHSLPKQHAPHEHAEVAHSEQHRSCSGCFASTFPKAIGEAREQPKNEVDQAEFPKMIRLAASMIGDSIIIGQRVHANAE